MHRFTPGTAHTAIAAFVGAFVASAVTVAGAVDPEAGAGDEAAAPAEVPLLAIWDREVRVVEAEGLRFHLEDDGLRVENLHWDERTIDFDVRCELAVANPMTRIALPPRLLSEDRLQRELVIGGVSRFAPRGFGLRPSAEDAGIYDSFRISIRRRGTPADSEPLAILQLPAS